MTATNGVAVVDKVRAAWAQADREGVRRPGRDKLVEITGESKHYVRKALEQLQELEKQKALEDLADPYSASSSSAVTSDSEPSPATAEHVHEHASTAPDMIELEPPGSPAEPAPVTRMPPGSPAGVTDSPAGAPAPPAGEPALAPGAKLVAWVGFAFGSIISIGANVLFTWLPAPEHPPGWWPGLWPQIGAAVWPIALLISVEALSRVAWKPGWLWGLARYGGAGTVALGSGVISYGHLKGLLLAWGYGDLEAGVGPLVIDGLMVISGFALLAMSSHQQLQEYRPGYLQ